MAPDEEGAVLGEDSHATGPAGLHGLRHIGRFHESEPGRDFVQARQDLLDLNAPYRILARDAGDFDVEDDDALVHYLVVFDVANESGWQQLTITRQEYARPRPAYRAIDHFCQL